VKLSRPAEAIGSFYAAAAANSEYFGEANLNPSPDPNPNPNPDPDPNLTLTLTR